MAFVTLILAASRPLAFVMVTPLFTRFGLQAGPIRAGILAAFAGPVMPGLYAEILAVDVIPFAVIVGYVLKELIIGLILALFLGVPLWAVAAAGDYIDAQRGAQMASIVDPGSGDEVTPTGTLFFLITALVLTSSDWFRDMLVASLYSSYAIWPILKALPAFDPAAGGAVLAVLSAVARTGLTLAIPILGSLLLTEFTLAAVGKYIQQLNVMFLAMAAKQVLYVILLPIYFTVLLYYVRDEVVLLQGTIDTMKAFFLPVTPPASGLPQ